MVQGAMVGRQFEGFVLGEDFGKVGIFLGNRRRVGLSFVDSGEIFGETEDSIEMQEIDFVVGIDFVVRRTFGGKRTGFAFGRRRGFSFEIREFLDFFFPIRRGMVISGFTGRISGVSDSSALEDFSTCD